MPPKKKAKPSNEAGENFRLRLPDARKARGFTSQAQLAERLTTLGYPIHETSIARIESGERKVSLDDALMITAVLGCQLAHLLAPADGPANISLSSRLSFTAAIVRDWIRGKSPLFLDDARYFFAGPLAPESDVRAFFSEGWSGYGREWSDVLEDERPKEIEHVVLEDEDGAQ